jgi:probable HAF family extracellular repeat protein
VSYIGDFVTRCGTPPVMDTDQGQVVGDSDLEGDVTQHGFSWKNGVLTDLGTLGEDFSTATWVNEAGEVVGFASTESGFRKAFRWRKGRMEDLGTVDGDLCSAAWSINERGQIVGNSAPNCDFRHEDRAFLWERGRVFDLNSFVPPDSDLYLYEADSINDIGDITGPAFLPNGDIHQYLLLRCFGNTVDCRESDGHVPPRTRNLSAADIRRSPVVAPLGGERGQN